MTGPFGALLARSATPLRRVLLEPHLCAVLAMLLWAGSFAFSREARETAPPIWLSFWRNTVAFAILFVLILPQIARDARPMFVHWRPLGLLGGLLIVGNTLMIIALTETTAVNGGIINSAEPAIIILIASIIARRMMTLFQLAGIAVSIVGVLILITRANYGVLASLDFNNGDLWMTGAIIAWSFYAILLQRAPMRDRPIAQTAAATFYASVLLLPWYVWDSIHRPPVSLGIENVVTVIYLALFASVFGVLFWVRAVHELGPARAGPYGHLMPVFTIALGIVFLGEPVHGYHAAGIVLIACGIYLASIVVAKRRAS